MGEPMSAPLSESTTDDAATDVVTDDTGAAAEGSDTGFPAGTPLAEMTTEQQLAYYKHQNRQAESKLAKFKGVTPKQFTDMQTRISELESQALSADEKALKEAVDTARAEAATEAQKLYLPRLQLSDIRGIAAPILDEDQLEGWLAGIDPKRFVGDDGEVDKDKVMTNLTAMFGRSRQQSSQVRQWGQYTNQTPATGQPGSAGRAEAQRRFPKT
jgi:streptomycin 6-kinase